MSSGALDAGDGAARTREFRFGDEDAPDRVPMKGPLDVIFCRNVVIYLDKDTQRELFERYARVQRPGDILFLGHSESMFKVSDDYTLINETIYRRNAT